MEPKQISDIVVRKRIRSKYQNTDDHDAEAREQTRLRALQAFDPRQKQHHTKTTEHVYSLIKSLLEVFPEAVLFKSIEGPGILIKNNANIIKIANEIIHKKKANDEKITEFLQNIVISDKENNLLEKSTRGLVNNSAWKELRKGRITVSVGHNVHTKLSNIAKKRKRPFPRTTTLVAKVILNSYKDLSKLPVITSGIKNKEKCLKRFYVEEACKQEKVKLQQCGLYIGKTRPFIAVSPDYIMHCKCHDQSVIEFKCPHAVRNKTLCDSFNEFSFLTKINDKITLKNTQIPHLNNNTNGTDSLHQKLLCCMG